MPPLPADDLEHVFAHTRELWEEARGEAFFIAGGSGFFNSWLIESFCFINDRIGLGMRAVVLTRDPGKLARHAPHLASRTDLTFVRGDLQSFDLPPEKFSYVIHAAATAAYHSNPPLETFDAIVGGTRRLLDFSAGCGVRKFLYIGSGTVYGPQPPGMTHVPEDYAGGPNAASPASAYAEAKRVSEFLAATYASSYGFGLSIARGFSFVGPRLPLDGHYAIGNFIRDALAGRPIRVNGNGTPLRSYLYGADLAIWLWAILFKGSGLGAFNVGSADSLSIAETARVVDRVLGGGGVEIADPVAGGEPSRHVPDVGKAKRALNLKETIPLETAIKKTAAWASAASARE